MLKLAAIFESSPFDRKGLFNAAHERIRHLVGTGRCVVDAYCIHSWDTAFTRKVRHTPEVPRKDEVTVDGITYRILWYDFSILDHVTVEFLHRRPLLFSRFTKRCMPLFKGYDAILAHSFAGGLFAMEASDTYGIPYFMTWHGSDIHTHPWKNSLVMEYTRKVMKGARYNFFVSEALLEASHRICADVPKAVLYNGVSDDFIRYDDGIRNELRVKYSLDPGTKVVAFAGSLVSVKNPDMLQPLFHEIRRQYEGPLKFWIIGDGKVRHQVEPGLMSDPTIDVVMWGNMPSDQMPQMMNCIDVLVLPSRNEGLPLVCAEAIRCGAYAVGADVGGVAEVVGKDNVIPHGDGFIVSMASKVVSVLNDGGEQKVPDHLDWRTTAEKEMSVILSSC